MSEAPSGRGTTALPYGSWASPLSASDLVKGAKGLAYPCRVEDRYLWEESRPEEKGRVAVVSRLVGGGAVAEALSAPMSARTRVHEYGGRAWAARGSSLVVSNDADGRLWALDLGPGASPGATHPGGAAPVVLTPERGAPGQERFAAPAISPDGLWAVCVRERHLPGAVVNDLVGVALPVAAPAPGASSSATGGGGAEPVVLAQGHDFYGPAAFSPEGTEVAFTCWDLPDMPWDRAELCRAGFSRGQLGPVEVVVSAHAGESVLEPRWSPTGALCYLSDRSGWWSLYQEGRPLALMEAELGSPPWLLGASHYTHLADETLVATWRHDGRSYLGTVADGAAVPWALPYTSFYGLSPAGPRPEEGVLAVAGSPAQPYQLVRATPEGEMEVLGQSQPLSLAEDMVSVGRHFSFPSSGGQKAHGLFYPPVNGALRAPEGEEAPLVVTSHGGPTSAASEVLNLRLQYWTTRGFAVADIDYRGSSGYGRAYRDALVGRWGQAEVEDCIAAARWLAREGWADGGRMVIRGSSASGMTALAAVARYDVFKAATALYGVGDLAALAEHTHKFERGYLEALVPRPQRAARSPLSSASTVRAPLLLVHGLEDKVVPPAQSEQMAAQVRAAGGQVYLVEVEGEGHGFRLQSTLARVQELELAFYAEVLGLAPADELSRAHQDLAQAGHGRARW